MGDERLPCFIRKFFAKWMPRGTKGPYNPRFLPFVKNLLGWHRPCTKTEACEPEDSFVFSSFRGLRSVPFKLMPMVSLP